MSITRQKAAKPAAFDPAFPEVWKRLEKLEAAVFTGNGQPPLVARVAAIERALQTQTWLIRAVLGGVLANLVGLAFLILRRGL